MNKEVEEFSFRLADRNDEETISALLEKSELPVEDLGSKITFFVGLDSTGSLAGCIGLEKYGKEGLLRSMAVDGKYRSKGLGSQLLDSLLYHCRGAGVSTLHLLTTTADQYFLKKGFRLADRAAAPASIRATTEFSSLCPASSVYMTLKIQDFD